MKRWLPVVYGFFGGAAIGFCLLFQVQGPGTTSISGDLAMAISSFLRKLLMPGDDPMAAFMFVIPVMVLCCALIGALVGCVISLSVMAVRRISSWRQQSGRGDS
jgi:hypothetical protein